MRTKREASCSIAAAVGTSSQHFDLTEDVDFTSSLNFFSFDETDFLPTVYGDGEGYSDSIKGVDFISCLPDVILHEILSSLDIKFVVRTSVLSKRWKHVWSETPSLSYDFNRMNAGRIDRLLNRYKAPKMARFLLRDISIDAERYIERWIKFAKSKDVEILTLSFLGFEKYEFPDFFYVNSSLKQLSVRACDMMIDRCTISWKSLEKLSLIFVKLSDESIANILLGCPKLESLTLDQCGLIQNLDLSKSLSLKRLEIVSRWIPGPTEIVAPHICYLSLTNSHKPCTLVDVSSLIEAYLDIENDRDMYINNTDFLQVMVLKMLAKLHNVERLTLTRTVLQILSFAELRGVSFPMLKVSTFIAETKILRYVIPGIVRLLQNSPGLKKLVVVHTTDDNYTIPDKELDGYLKSQSLDTHQCWRSTNEMFPSTKEIYSMLHCKGATSKLLVSFIELVMRNAHALEIMVVQFKDKYGEIWFKQLLQMPPTLSHRNNVSIVLNQKNHSIVASVK